MNAPIMKIKKTIIGCFLLFVIYNAYTQINYPEYFTTQSLQVDYGVAVDADTIMMFPPSYKLRPEWAGNQENLLDTIDGGVFMIEVCDSTTGALIFSKKYSSLSQEYQLTGNAGYFREYFEESVIIPFPRSTVLIRFLLRKYGLTYSEMGSGYVNPSLTGINKEELTVYTTEDLLIQGTSKDKVDIVFLPEGYTQEEMDKFRSDVKSFVDTLFSWSPYSEYKSSFNIRAVLAASADNGIDIPSMDIWKNTLLDASFGTFGSERYVTVPRVQKLRDVASCVPYDHIIILVNSDKYGGGGIYNCYSIFAAHNIHSGFLFLHEFGHGFADLADEYFNEDVITYYADTLHEPYAVNLTTLVDFNSKWADLVEGNTPVPTPAVKSNINVVGAYEGGAYASKGIYRSMQSCTMKDVVSNKFCPACKRGIIRMILFNTGMQY